MTAVVVQVAMADEAAPLIALADEVSEPVRLGGAEHRGLVFAGRTVVLVRSGIGMVNAAAAAAGAVHRYGDDQLLVSAGSAGGVAAGLAVGELQVASAAINLGADATAFGYAPGQVPRMPESYPSDEAVRAAAERMEGPVRTGLIGSSDAFVTAARAAEVREKFPAVELVDMETCAIAQVAHTHGARFAAVRVVSDLCAPDAGEFHTHIDDAAERSARAVRELIGLLP